MDEMPGQARLASDSHLTTEQALAMIDSSLTLGNLGQAFRGYLFLLQADPGCKDRIRDDFGTVLHQWTDHLDVGGSREDALWCYETSRRLWPDNAEIHNNMGAFYYRLGQHEEAASCFRLALEIDPGYTRAQKNLTNVVCSHVKGWHFPMLNDKKRNLCYQTAITKAVAQGHSTVLDIGSGTGLLSMFAVNAGAKSVFACEESKEMVEITCDVLAANQMQDKVQLQHKLSTDMSVPYDIPNRVSLVVTEIFDAGLFGEGVINTLQHAWKQLLLPPKTSDSQEAGSYGKVIPYGAVVYAQVIQCKHIRRQYRLLPDKICNLNVSNLNKGTLLLAEYQSLQGDPQNEPYTSERLESLPYGYQALTPVIKVFEVDFNDPQIITSGHPTTNWRHLDFPVVSSGQVDAIVSWFDLCLDDTNRLSSSPHSSSCWEQAVFPVTLSSSFEPEENGQEYLSVSKRDSITVAVSCYDDCLHLKCTKISHHDSSKMESTPSPMPDTTHEEIMEKMVTSFKENVSTGQDESRNSEHQEKVCEDVGVTVSSMGGAVSSIDSYSHPCHSCDMLRPDTLAIMNDNKVNTAYYNAIKTIITGNRLPVRHDTTSDSLNYSSPRKSQNSISEGTSSPPTDKPSNYVCESVSPMFGVLDISVGVPLTGLFAAKHLNAARVCIPTTESVTRTLIETVARTNGIEDCVAFEVEPHPLSPSSETVWDVLVTDLVAPCGTLRERVLEDIAVGRVCALKPTGVVIPGTLSVFAMCIQCASLWTDSEVVGNESTMGLKIAEFINQYKVSTFLDIHLSTRVYKQLSKPFLLFHLNFNEKQMANSSDLPSFVNQSTVQQFEATEDGMITAIPFWYNIGVDVSNHVNTLDNETHWKQAAYLLAEGLDVRKGDQVKVTARIEDSSFLFEVEVG